MIIVFVLMLQDANNPVIRCFGFFFYFWDLAYYTSVSLKKMKFLIVESIIFINVRIFLIQLKYLFLLQHNENPLWQAGIIGINLFVIYVLG